MDALCGGKEFWNDNLTWSDEQTLPEFTECFRDTVLTWIASGWLAIALPFYLLYILRCETSPIARSSRYLTKLSLATLQVALCMREYYHRKERLEIQGEQLLQAYLAAPLTEAATMVGIVITMEMVRRKGFVTSGVLFIYWVLAAVTRIIPCYTHILHQTYEEDFLEFAAFSVGYSLIVAQLILSCFAEEVDLPRSVRGGPCPEPYASFLSKLTFQWADGLVKKGYENPLEEEDIFDLNPIDKAGNNVPLFEAQWGTERSKQLSQRSTKAKKTDENMNEENNRSSVPTTQISLIKVILKTFSWQIMFLNAAKITQELYGFVNPLLVKLLIDYMGDDGQATWKGFALALCFMISSTSRNLIGVNVGMQSCQLEKRIKAALTSSIFKKVLRMNNKERKETTVGEIVNVVSKDAEHIPWLFCHSCFMWVSPINVSLAILGLYYCVGTAMFAGLAIIVLLLPFQTLLNRKLRALHKDDMTTTDERIKLTTEVLNGIKILKLYAWEMAFGKKIDDIREKEIGIMRSAEMWSILMHFSWTLAPFMVGIATLATYVSMQEEHLLDAQTAFVAMSFLNILRHSVNMLPNLVLEVSKARISLNRVDKFLNGEEIDESSITHHPSEEAITLEGASFSWDTKAGKNLKNINLAIPKGSLVAVVGQVGAGKSSLMSAILGDMEKVSGDVNIDGSIGYVSQQAWIQNATVRDNILFGNPMKPSKFDTVIDACALRSDLEVLPGKELTEIGEKGVNLSGGQKQRVSMARAVYFNSDIYIMDDPLSAVDSHVGKHIFEQVIGNKGLLRNKTRVLVTHGVQWLPSVDQIVVLTDGVVSEVGSYQQLLDHDGAFAQFLKTYSQESSGTESSGDEADKTDGKRKHKEPVSKRGLRHRVSRKRDTSECENKSSKKNDVHCNNATSGTCTESAEEDDSALKKELTREISADESPAVLRSLSIMEEETGNSVDDARGLDSTADDESVETGNVRWSVITTYYKAFGILPAIAIFTLYAMNHVATVMSDVSLAGWTNDKELQNITLLSADSIERLERNNNYLLVYGLTGFLQAVLSAAYSFVWIGGRMNACRTMHRNLLTNILRSPMSFFDTTPVGRIVNRFSHDIGTVDGAVPHQTRAFFHCVIHYISTFFVICYTIPSFAIIIPPIVFVYYSIRNYVVPTYRQIKRIRSKTRSPIFSFFSESVNGVSVIRAFGLQERFAAESEKRVDRHHRVLSANAAVAMWLSIRIQVLGSIIVFTAAVLNVLGKDSLTAALTGLAITYAINLTDSLQWLVHISTELESNIISVERVQSYTESPTEAPLVMSKRPSPQWPENGKIELNSYSVRYREGLDLVLKGVDASINPGEKVGIVGRTGAGKSSLTLSVFRLVEPASGNIVIDGQNISDIGLSDLRSTLSILPQDPVLFSGSLRMNIDPLDEHTDSALTEALEHAHLKPFVDTLPDGLNYEVGEGGQNLSVGQRQLVCLARSLLKKSKILVLDEATAAVDMETDDLIQKTIRTEFKDCTVLTIAHRLNTIIDYDRILVLDKGQVKEFDSPQNLLKDEQSTFYSMAKDANLV